MLLFQEQADNTETDSS